MHCMSGLIWDVPLINLITVESALSVVKHTGSCTNHPPAGACPRDVVQNHCLLANGKEVLQPSSWLMLQVLAICPFHHPQLQLDPPALSPCLDPRRPILQPQVSFLALLMYCLRYCAFYSAWGLEARVVGQITYAMPVCDMINDFHNMLWGAVCCICHACFLT